VSQLQVGHHHFVVGQAPDLHHARRVSEYVQHHGVDANDIRLAATAAERAEQRTSDLAARDQRDGVARRHARRQAEAGALIGALAGAAIGAAGGLLATAGHVGRDLTFFLAIVLVFTGLGAWVAASVSAARSMGFDDPWALTLDGADDSAWIAVRVRNDRDADRTRELLKYEGISLVEEHTAETRGIHTVRW
jgi:hypothetical protein